MPVEPLLIGFNGGLKGASPPGHLWALRNARSM